ncbi:PTS fructose transporter subunit IIC [Oenococcus oeni]|uniref:PTS EIIC type-2 domain-containing protein n=4 Tax=Oenococcus oeni TaxID=1247 RepID=D3LAY7_OENOE|nr:PTS fructose transporter subunit IIC [Oenococcus oeni]EJN92327.1 PTS system, fructose-specific IIC component [Oenococcus oeni AWRIB304]EJO10181.1 PTS system, fructose-specific IIC component [Oenococcus oeni AWRIB576]EJO10763.1 PTS system, fructose-specific IIC component [Oenococcus oeni AWRIB568]EKP90935.1 PTS system, fructose-specific IIC component [Oenococcus oeni AWRIB202]KGH64195.1 PTS mannose transporter subunit IIAB [Oenococcus oeni IOEB_CiNe]KGH71504.1 PTS mannose transporter subuni
MLSFVFLNTDDGWGGTALGLMFPVISAYIAYSIADKGGIAPGIIGGMLVSNMNAGFLGALASGLIAGYTVKFMIAHIHLPNVAKSVLPVFIVPVLGSLITLILIQYVIGVPFADLNTGLASWLKGLTGTNKILLAAIVGGMVGFDLGGPVNKAAVTTAMALLTSGVYDPNTAAQVAIIIPPLGLGLATVINKRKFNKELQEAGNAALVMGLIGVSEGAIPFAVESPLRVIPANVIGSAIGSSVAVGLGAVNRAPISGFYGWLAVEKWWVYVLGILVGTLTVTGLTLLFRKQQPVIQETETPSDQQTTDDSYFTENQWEN